MKKQLRIIIATALAFGLGALVATFVIFQREAPTDLHLIVVGKPEISAVRVNGNPIDLHQEPPTIVRLPLGYHDLSWDLPEGTMEAQILIPEGEFHILRLDRKRIEFIPLAGVTSEPKLVSLERQVAQGAAP
jgi:hypothetical protein